MTARFGRNKRRVAREAVSAAQTTAERATRIAREAALQRDRATADLDYIATELVRALGPQSSILPLHMSRPERNLDPDIRRWPIGTAGMRTMPWMPLNPTAVTTVDLVRVVAELHHDPRGLVAAITFRDINDTGEFKHGASVVVSLKTFRSRGLDRDAVKFLLEDVENRFVDMVFGSSVRRGDRMRKLREAARG